MSASDPPLPQFRSLRNLHRKKNHYMSRQQQRETGIDRGDNRSCGRSCTSQGCSQPGLHGQPPSHLPWPPAAGWFRNEEFGAFEARLLALPITFCHPTNTRKHHAAKPRPCSTDWPPARGGGSAGTHRPLGFASPRMVWVGRDLKAHLVPTTLP